MQIHFENTLGEGTPAHFQSMQTIITAFLGYQIQNHTSIVPFIMFQFQISFWVSDPSGSHGLRPSTVQPFNSFLTYRSSGDYRLTFLAYHQHGWLPITWPTSQLNTWPLTCMHLLPGEGYGLQPIQTDSTHPIKFFLVNDLFPLYWRSTWHVQFYSDLNTFFHRNWNTNTELQTQSQ